MNSEQKSQVSRSLYLTNTELLETVVNNLLLMIYDRKLLTKKDMEQQIKKINNDLQNKGESILNLTNADRNGVKQINIYYFDFTNKAKNMFSNIPEYTKERPLHNIVIVHEISDKQYVQQLSTAVQNTNEPSMEIFKFESLLIHLPDCPFVPVHQLLNSEQKNNFIKSYDIKLEHLPIISFTDPMTRYYNANIGDVFRIIRNSPATGKSFYYRIVKKIKN